MEDTKQTYSQLTNENIDVQKKKIKTDGLYMNYINKSSACLVFHEEISVEKKSAHDIDIQRHKEVLQILESEITLIAVKTTFPFRSDVGFVGKESHPETAMEFASPYVPVKYDPPPPPFREWIRRHQNHRTKH